jgi:hypothetical protein
MQSLKRPRHDLEKEKWHHAQQEHRDRNRQTAERRQDPWGSRFELLQRFLKHDLVVCG